MVNNAQNIGTPFAQATKAYEHDIIFAASEILDIYDIPNESLLADTIYRGLVKIILGLDEKLKAYDQWFDLHGKKIEKIKRDYTGSYPQDCVYLAQKFNIEVSAEYDRLLKVDIGRNKIVLNTLAQLSKYADQAGNPYGDKPSYLILGSIIRRALNIHQDHKAEGIEASVDREPKQAIAALKSLRSQASRHS